MAVATRYKDPNSKRKLTISWARWLASQGGSEVIADSDWTVPAGLDLIDEAFDNNHAVAWISGGTLNATYLVVNRVVTSTGQIEDATVEIIMREN